ncbi:MAG TPA: hypothetical protein VK363_12635 [Pyrinomonadaceae bacterium]|nr:hypothetical protein [Pyrinomonadaceae bacterium]
MWLERLKVAAVVLALVGFVAMLLGIAWADRAERKRIAEGQEPKFSWAWFIFSIYLLAQGVSKFISECIRESHKAQGAWANYLWQGAAILLLAIGITFFAEQIKWLIYIRRHKE